MLSTDHIESTRIQALKFFNADPDQFDLIFVPNATAAIKLIMDCMIDYSQSQNGFWYGYHGDAHTSLVGVREVAARGSRCFLSDEEVEQWLSSRDTSQLGTSEPPSGDYEVVRLFAYPAQSNMNGRRLPLSWPGRLRSSACPGFPRVYSLLDAAALVATAPLDLSDFENAPDFTALSFYKIFGFPDLGALIVRKEADHILSQRRYFGGGTVDMVINGQIRGNNKDGWYARKTASLHDMLEDGTPAFHSIIALGLALKVHKKLFGSMANVSKHLSNLVRVLYEEMSTLSYANSLLVCQIYKNPSSQYGDSNTQGPTIAFNVRRSNGEWLGKSDFERLAVLNNIQIRTGGLCNAGGIAASLQISPTEMLKNFEEGVRCGNEVDKMNGKPTGVIRVSLGAMSSVKDISSFMSFMRLFVTSTPESQRVVVSLGHKGCTRKASSHKGSQASRLECLVQVVETPGIFECPLVVCESVFESRDRSLNHLPTHAATRRRRRRLIWPETICRHFG